MKLTIKDGRDHFYTFDTNRILLLTATDEDMIKQVEFSTEENGEEVSWTSEVLTGSDGVKYVQVPNEFLNGDYTRLVCYYVALDSNGEYTRQKEIFRIRARQEPQDYYLTYSERVTFASIKALTEQYKATTKGYMDTTEGFKDNAGRSAELASKYAENNEDVAVEPGKYSAKHWSIKAEAAKETAVQKATEAGTSEGNAKTYMESAQSAKQDAETAKNAANTILEQVKSKGTEITNFMATSKTEIETQKDESVNAVKSVYQTDLNELKGDLSDNAKSDAKTKLSLNALWKLNQGISYQFETDDTAAYRKTVPSGAKVASVQKIGGRTIVWNQLVSSDAVIITPASNHIIVRRIDGVWTLIASDGSGFSVTGGTDMVFDLSAMFGAGNEPSTVAEFRSMFPEDYYPYNPGELISFPVHAVVKRGKNIWGGDAVRASLEALGIDASGNNVNIPGFKVEKKVILAVQPKLGTQYTFLLTSRLLGGTGTITVVSNFKFRYDDGTEESIKMVRNDSMSMVKTSSNPAKTLTGIVGDFQITNNFYLDPDRTGLFEGNVNKESYLPYIEPVAYPIPEAVMALDGYCVGSNYIDFEQKQFIKQCEIVDGEVVDLAAPVVTDISDLIVNAFQEPLIVEAGGNLTFQNTNGDGYQIPVPSNIEYLISLAEVNG